MTRKNENRRHSNKQHMFKDVSVCQMEDVVFLCI